MFKKFAVIAVVAVSCFIVAGCMSVRTIAPADADVKLMSRAESASYQQDVKNWYVLWGYIPIKNAEEGVQNCIRDNNLKEVRVETKVTVADWLISAVLSIFSVAASTTVIEGNR